MFDSLLADVAAAFPAKPLSRTLFDDPTNGWRSCYDEAHELESAVDGRTWAMLDAPLVESHHGALRFMTPEAFVAVLPAYLVAFIKYEDSMDFLPGYLVTQLTRRQKLQEDFDARVGLLTEEQRLVIARSLAEVLQSGQYTWRNESIQAALDSYWGELLDPPR